MARGEDSVHRHRIPEGWLGKALLGDWNPVVRDPLDLVRASYLAGAVYAFASGDSGNGVRFVLTFAVVLLPRILNAPRPFDLFFAGTFGLQAWGNLVGAFGNNGDLFDRLDHLFSPMGLAPLFYIWFVRMALVPDLHEEVKRFHRTGIVVIGFSIGLSVGALYEIYEYVANNVAGAALHISERDTIFDMSMDALGALVGSVILCLWTSLSWGSSRRVPGG